MTWTNSEVTCLSTIYFKIEKAVIQSYFDIAIYTSLKVTNFRVYIYICMYIYNLTICWIHMVSVQKRFNIVCNSNLVLDSRLNKKNVIKKMWKFFSNSKLCNLKTN